MQAIFPAQNTPSWKDVLADLGSVKRYRDVATNWAPRVRQQLEDAWARCKARKILIAGYSLGNIVLRYVLANKNLPSKLRDQIVSVDLIADPTADASVDKSLQHPAELDGRLTQAGIDTVGARTLWKFLTVGAVAFDQSPYPSGLTSRVFQYCMDDDIVCDFDLPLGPAVVNQGKVHESYAFGVIGIAAARRAGLAPREVTIVVDPRLGRQSVSVAGVELFRDDATAHVRIVDKLGKPTKCGNRGSLEGDAHQFALPDITLWFEGVPAGCKGRDQYPRYVTIPPEWTSPFVTLETPFGPIRQGMRWRDVSPELRGSVTKWGTIAGLTTYYAQSQRGCTNKARPSGVIHEYDFIRIHVDAHSKQRGRVYSFSISPPGTRC